MDTSETYIKMCEKATEIQALAPSMQTRIHLSMNIFNCSTKDDSAFFWCMDTFEDDDLGNSVLTDTVAIWLPRQDQLQKMVFGVSGDIQGQVWKLYEFVTDNRATCPRVSSMEQLWLAFVMQEKYSKQWMGEEWVEI